MESSEKDRLVCCADAGTSLFSQHRILCELRTLAASQIGALLAFLLAMGFFLREAWLKSPENHKQFFDAFAFIFTFTALYFFMIEWTIEEDHIEELRNLATPEVKS